MTPTGLFLRFEFVRDTGRTRVWEVQTADRAVILGYIKWYAPWRRYTFYPEAETIYDPVCLRALADACEVRTQEHRRTKRESEGRA